MKIFLIRHSETKESLEKIILGHLDGNLSEKGILESKNIAKFIKINNLNIKKIFSSDLKRAKQTVEIINKNLNLEIKYLDILRERKAGVAEGKKENEIDWEVYEQKSLAYRKHIGGESFLDVKKRAKKFFEIIQKEKQNILVISHSVFILMFICFFKKISIKKALEIDIKNKIICIDLEKRKIEFVEI